VGVRLGQILSDGTEGPPRGQLADLVVAEPGNLEREVFALAVRETGQDGERFASFEDVVDAKGIVDRGLTRSGRQDCLEVRVPSLGFAQAAGLASRDDVKPEEGRGAVRLCPQEDRPYVLARILDELARGADDIGDRAQEIAVVAPVELGVVAA
jgi:hypothetical protein